MANQSTAAGLIASLASQHRVLTLGGFAVISHGLSRPTYDADIWLDPNLSSVNWCAALQKLTALSSGLRFVEIGTWRPFSDDNLETVIERDGVVRLMGADQPLDIFRRPNELEISTFGEVWDRAVPLKDGTRFPDAIDLLVTKQLTGRAKDHADIFFLEQKAEAESLALLSTGDPKQICALLERFLTPNLAAAAMRHADAGVRELALRYLRELAAEGDPFAADLLRDV